VSSSASPSATERLRSRLQQRGEKTASDSRQVQDAGSNPNAAIASSWKERIEMRKRQAEEREDQEADVKHQLDERSCRRNDAMRRVMERQAQRQQEVILLEA